MGAMDFFDPTHPYNHPLPQEKGFKWWGGGGVPTKNSSGDVFIGQNNDLKRGETNNSTLGVDYANWPKRRGGGGMWRFPMYAGLRGMISNLCKVI